jgi:hypothetical protein
VDASNTAPHPAQACREALFALALAVTRHPEIEAGSRDGFLEGWLALGTPAARAAWQELAINASFWVRLDDGQRARVGAWLGQPGIAPQQARRRLERLLASPTFAGAQTGSRDGMLREIGVPAPAKPAPAEPVAAGPAAAGLPSEKDESEKGASEVQAGLVQPLSEGGATGGGVVGGAVPAGGLGGLGLARETVGAGVHPGEGGGVGGIVGIQPGEGVLAGGGHVAAAGAGAGVGL